MTEQQILSCERCKGKFKRDDLCQGICEGCHYDMQQELAEEQEDDTPKEVDE